MGHADKFVRNTPSGDVLPADAVADAERAAYQRMQDALRYRSARDQKDLDLVTPEGRRRRSQKNLDYLAENNSDCPDLLHLRLTEAVSRKQLTIKHSVWDISIDPQDIVKSGALLSNLELKRRNVKVRGGTAGSSVNDDEEFGNTHFLFTYPVFHDPGEALPSGERHFYIPPDEGLIENSTWLSFRDWASMTKDNYLGNKQRERGRADEDTRLHSVAYDFFVGKKDISQAVAYKTFEALKTAIMLYRDESHPLGFNEEKASHFLQYLMSDRYRNGALGNDNTLERPLKYYHLSEVQQEFLADNDNPVAQKMIRQALASTLHTMSKEAELKVPHSLSLDGAAIGDTRLGSDEARPHPRHYSRREEGQQIIITPESMKFQEVAANFRPSKQPEGKGAP